MIERKAIAQKLPTVAFILKKGKRYEGPLFTIWLLTRPKGKFRSFVVCSKKVDKRAIKRNTLKRRMREILRKEYAKSYPTSDFVVRMKPAANNLPTKKLKESMYYVLPIS